MQATKPYYGILIISCYNEPPCIIQVQSKPEEFLYTKKKLLIRQKKKNVTSVAHIIHSLVMLCKNLPFAVFEFQTCHHVYLVCESPYPCNHLYAYDVCEALSLN